MVIRLGILGAGGLGRGMATMAKFRPQVRVVAMADRRGYVYNPEGVAIPADGQSVAELGVAVPESESAVQVMLREHGAELDALFVAMPNLPVTFYADTLRDIVDRTPFQGTIVDALKRTRAVAHLLPLDGRLRERGVLYITGAGATPGFLSTIAAVAAQSFAEVLSVNIHFGVGVANWESYRATIKEDFLHLPGFDAERVAAMTDEDIVRELDARNGLLELVNMEHADDLLLALSGVCPADRVTVGGLVDTRSPNKPVQTTVTIQGRTAAGVVAQHQFMVANETTMVDNVCGPALGFLQRGVALQRDGQMAGLYSSTDLMPLFGAPQIDAAMLARVAPAAEALPQA